MLSVDYAERDGFLVGKSARLADWRHRKELAEAQALYSRLMSRRYYWSDPAREREKARQRWARHAAEVQAAERAETLRRNAALVRRPCEVCGGEIAPWKRPQARYCCRRCSQVARSRAWRARHAEAQRRGRCVDRGEVM